MKWIHKVSQLFQPQQIIPKNSLPKTDLLSKSYQLMINAGIISNVSPGMYAFLPLGLRSLQKLTSLVDEEMSYIGGQKILLPILTLTHLWKETSRLEQAKPELFTLSDRHGKEYLLSPTFEESITNMIAQVKPFKRDYLPLRLYQISSKWRDEMKPRLGLLRSREFVMKDMYTFDLDPESAKRTYEEVNGAYEKVFNRIGIPYYKVVADAGIIGGSLSHEYQYLSDIGEDVIRLCKKCGYYDNARQESRCECPKCTHGLERVNSVEVGHTFLLGTKYSKPLKATFVDKDNKDKLLSMGSYGLGLTRIMAAAIEILSTDTDMKWPLEIAPYSVCIIPPKAGSKEESVTQLAYDLYSKLQDSNVDVIIDDRSKMTIGKRILDARKCGYPFVIVVGKGCLDAKPLMELHNLYKASRVDLAIEDIVDHLKGLLKSCTDTK